MDEKEELVIQLGPVMSAKKQDEHLRVNTNIGNILLFYMDVRIDDDDGNDNDSNI